MSFNDKRKCTSKNIAKSKLCPKPTRLRVHQLRRQLWSAISTKMWSGNADVYFVQIRRPNNTWWQDHSLYPSTRIPCLQELHRRAFSLLSRPLFWRLEWKKTIIILGICYVRFPFLHILLLFYYYFTYFYLFYLSGIIRQISYFQISSKRLKKVKFFIFCVCIFIVCVFLF